MNADQKGFYVEPKRDCPHIDASYTPSTHSVPTNGPCTSCNDTSENWACLTCSKKFCSRYVKGHMAAHYDESKHPLCVSYSDFSFWCYACDSYITDYRFSPMLKALSAAKFGDAGTGGRYTSHASQEQMEEKEDSTEELEKKIKKLAKMVKESEHVIAFTGAGISTSAGIPDFRGPQGVWTLKATGQARTARTVPPLSAIPTPCHMALVKLSQEDIMKHVISQNVDGIHRKSGIPPAKLSELHGNTNLEVCDKCGKEYMRDFDCGRGSNVLHQTGRKCSVDGCDGNLIDTIINFGESLPLHTVQKGFEEAEQADLCICLGSSLTVTPAADMPKIVGKKKGTHLVIVNLQKTPLDRLASLRIFGKCDAVMEGLLKELGLELPRFILQRRVILSHDEGKLSVDAVDVDGTPLSLFVGVGATFKGSGRKEEIDMDDGAFVFKTQEGDGEEVEMKLHFIGHYNEPPLAIDYKMEGDKGSKKFLISFDPVSNEWTSEEAEITPDDLMRGKGANNTALTEEEMLQKYPKTIKDKRHIEHELTLVPSVYNGGYRCNSCMKVGSGWVYTCADCQYDLHPACAIWRRGVKD